MNNGVTRLVEVLESLANSPNGLTVTELSCVLGITKASASRILSAYVEAGLAYRDAAQRHVPGLRLWSLGVKALQFFRIAEIARPMMLETSKAARIGLYLATVQGERVYYIEQVGPGIPVLVPIATVLPIHASGPGKAILAYSSEEAIASVLNKPLRRFTKETITSKQAFLKELDDTRRRGYAINRGEYEEQAVGVAVPVFNHAAEPVASVGSTCAAADFGDEYIARVSPILVEFGTTLSAALGYARFGPKVG